MASSVAINAKNAWIDFQTRLTIGYTGRNQLAAGPLDALALLAIIWSAVAGMTLGAGAVRAGQPAVAGTEKPPAP